MSKGKKRIKLGDVHAIVLPNQKFAFGRVFWDASIGIYKHIGDNIDDLPTTEEYQFVVGVYADVLKSGNWPVVDNRPFSNNDEKWPPPNCVKDKISGGYSIYYRGEFRKASKEECEGLETAAVWEAEHIIDRIMGSDKWHQK
jgi:hypothetical protein